MTFFSNINNLHLSLTSFPTRRSSDLRGGHGPLHPHDQARRATRLTSFGVECLVVEMSCCRCNKTLNPDRKSTRLNSSHVKISYAVFCLKKKKKKSAIV